MAYEEAGKPSYKDCIALTPKVQRNAVWGKPHSSVVILLLYSSAFVRYSAGRRIIRQNAENVVDIQVLCAGVFSRERTGIIFFCVVHTFSSTIQFTRSTL